MAQACFKCIGKKWNSQWNIVFLTIFWSKSNYIKQNTTKTLNETDSGKNHPQETHTIIMGKQITKYSIIIINHLILSQFVILVHNQDSVLKHAFTGTHFGTTKYINKHLCPWICIRNVLPTLRYLTLKIYVEKKCQKIVLEVYPGLIALPGFPMGVGAFFPRSTDS